eukprot:1158805-Pelagomonas_calceolata.AAC.9
MKSMSGVNNGCRFLDSMAQIVKRFDRVLIVNAWACGAVAVSKVMKAEETLYINQGKGDTLAQKSLEFPPPQSYKRTKFQFNKVNVPVLRRALGRIKRVPGSMPNQPRREP